MNADACALDATGAVLLLLLVLACLYLAVGVAFAAFAKALVAGGRALVDTAKYVPYLNEGTDTPTVGEWNTKFTYVVAIGWPAFLCLLFVGDWGTWSPFRKE